MWPGRYQPAQPPDRTDIFIRESATADWDYSRPAYLHGGVGGQQSQVPQGDAVRPGGELVLSHEGLQPPENLLQVVELVLAGLLSSLKHHGVGAISISLIRIIVFSNNF